MSFTNQIGIFVPLRTMIRRLTDMLITEFYTYIQQSSRVPLPQGLYIYCSLRVALFSDIYKAYSLISFKPMLKGHLLDKAFPA